MQTGIIQLVEMTLNVRTQATLTAAIATSPLQSTAPAAESADAAEKHDQLTINEARSQIAQRILDSLLWCNTLPIVEMYS